MAADVRQLAGVTSRSPRLNPSSASPIATSWGFAGAGTSKASTLQPLKREAGARVAPASQSLYESSLRLKTGWTTPRMKVLDLVQHSLEQDAARQNMKYCGLQPGGETSRFRVAAPSPGCSMKYSWNARPSTTQMGLPPSHVEESSETASTKGGSSAQRFVPGMRVTKQTLHTWYTAIDGAGHGVITLREFIVFFQQQKNFVSMFGGGADGSLREGTRHVKEMLRQIQPKTPQSLLWLEFVELFRRAGLLLEVSTEHHGVEQQEIHDYFNDENFSSLREELHTMDDAAHAQQLEVTPSSMGNDIRTILGHSQQIRFTTRKRAVSLNHDAPVVNLPSLGGRSSIGTVGEAEGTPHSHRRQSNSDSTFVRLPSCGV